MKTTPVKKIDVLPPRAPIVYISAEAKMKLDLYIELAEGEVSGLGEVKILNHQDLFISEVYLLKQTCTPSDTKIDHLELSRFILSFMETGGDPATIKLWWHSHADMAVFWSLGTDEKTIQGFKNKWMLSLVGNKIGDYMARLDLYDPIRITLDRLPFRVLQVPDETVRELLRNEVSEKVAFSIPQEPVYVPNDFPKFFENVRKKPKRRHV